MELEKLKAIYDNSPVGFALGELEYDSQGHPVNFYIRYINMPGARVLNSLPENLIDKPYIDMFPETDQRWIEGFCCCMATKEKQTIKGYSLPLKKHLSVLCFPVESQMLGCFLRDITNETAEVIQKYNQPRVMSSAEHDFTDIITVFAGMEADEEQEIQAVDIDANAILSLYEDCIASMTEHDQLEVAFQEVIQRLCEFFHADKGSMAVFYGVDALAAWAATGRYESVFFRDRPSLKTITEWTRLLKGQKYLVVSDTSDQRLPDEVREKCEKQGIYSLHLQPILADQLMCGCILLVNVLLAPSQIYVMNFIVRTISRLIQNRIVQEKSNQLQFRDALTGYLNLEGFMRSVEDTIRINGDKKYALWYCDIKRFKYINDMFGYAVGDALLKYWANICDKHNRPGESFGRSAADNFVLLREYTSVEDLETAFYMDEAALADFAVTKSKGYTPELTCGIYLLDEEDMKNPDINKIMDKANIAQKWTQEGTGAHYVIYDESMRQKQLRELDIGQHMREGIKAGEFSIWLQPQYDYVTGRIVGAEALVRWKHPQLGNISPAEFIPILERSGQITELDMFVWEEACRYLRDILDHPERFRAIPISINISRIDIYATDLEQILLTLIRKYDLEAEMLRLEITESAYTENPEQLIETVEKLQKCGFLVEMDDFGSGYSSLNILKDVPVEVLKLDMNFLAGTEDTDRRGNILSSIIRMARWLGMDLIAEGVETVEQAEYLKNLGCSYMQGYYFAKPMPKEEFKLVLERADVAPDWSKQKPEKKVINSGQFLRSQSEAAYIFNSCIGGAALMEYEPGRLEVLLLNDLFLEVHGIPYEAAYRYWNNMFDFCVASDKDRLIACVEAAIEKGVATVEVHPAEVPDNWIRCIFRCLSGKGNSYIVFVLVEDITEHKRVEEKLEATILELQTLMDTIPKNG